MALAHLVRPHVGKPCGTAFFSKAHLRTRSSGEKSQNPCREKEKNRDRGCGRPVEAAISSAVCDGVCLVADSGKLSLSPDQFTEPSAASLLRTPRTGRYTGVVSEGVCPACGGAEIQNFLAQAVSLVGIDIDEISHNWLHASRPILSDLEPLLSSASISASAAWESCGFAAFIELC